MIDLGSMLKNMPFRAIIYLMFYKYMAGYVFSAACLIDKPWRRVDSMKSRHD